MDRRRFLSVVGLVPVVVKFRGLEKLFGVKYFDPDKAMKVFSEEVDKYVSKEHWTFISPSWDLPRKFVFVNDVCDLSDGSSYVVRRWVAQLVGMRNSDKTHFYQSLSFDIDTPDSDDLVRAKSRAAIQCFDSWKDCGCKVGFDCVKHGGPRTWNQLAGF
jgi:hypothetical protein